MENLESLLKTRIRTLAKIERGQRTRKEMYGDGHGVSFNTYENFEMGKNWPQATSLRKIEHLLGWNNGVIDEALEAGLEPAQLTLDHMHGIKQFRHAPAELRGFADSELMLEMERRMAERKRIADTTKRMFDLLAAREGIENIDFDQLPDE